MHLVAPAARRFVPAEGQKTASVAVAGRSEADRLEDRRHHVDTFGEAVDRPTSAGIRTGSGIAQNERYMGRLVVEGRLAEQPMVEELLGVIGR